MRWLEKMGNALAWLAVEGLGATRYGVVYPRINVAPNPKYAWAGPVKVFEEVLQDCYDPDKRDCLPSDMAQWMLAKKLAKDKRFMECIHLKQRVLGEGVTEWTGRLQVLPFDWAEERDVWVAEK
jgi:hypothetical protein